MTDTIIKAENLGKKYTIGHQSERGGYRTLRELVVQNARDLWHKTRDLAQGKPVIQGDTFEEVWALRDVNFEIRKGEAVGIIGRNGAGKSTLLKILSRITEPTTGRVTLKGRVASLLEVGTGFHPELSGRENIYLNGAILGMTRAEIARKFDEIVAFAEVEKYLDTPVKRYSSGMYVRLAFAVAAHLEPEILVVDEVLAVGDAAFQEKCLGKMGDVANEGRTVLFVSHNMAAISTLCSKCMLVENGSVSIFSEDVQKVINRYIEPVGKANAFGQKVNTLRTQYFEVHDFALYQEKGSQGATTFSSDEEIQVQIHAEIFVKDRTLNIGYALYDVSTNTCLWWSYILDANLVELEPGHYSLRSSIPANLLNEGLYRAELIGGLHNIKWLAAPGLNQVMIDFSVMRAVTGTWFASGTSRPGVFFLIRPWKIEALS
jgi:lipopolysaccharide transport system ATP-binding protein